MSEHGDVTETAQGVTCIAKVYSSIIERFDSAAFMVEVVCERNP